MAFHSHIYWTVKSTKWGNTGPFRPCFGTTRQQFLSKTLQTIEIIWINSTESSNEVSSIQNWTLKSKPCTPKLLKMCLQTDERSRCLLVWSWVLATSRGWRSNVLTLPLKKPEFKAFSIEACFIVPSSESFWLILPMFVNKCTLTSRHKVIVAIHSRSSKNHLEHLEAQDRCFKNDVFSKHKDENLLEASRQLYVCKGSP